MSKKASSSIRQTPKSKDKTRPTRKASKRKSRSRLVKLLDSRFGIMLIGAAIIFGFLMLVAMLPVRAALPNGQRTAAKDYGATLIAAPLVEAIISTPVPPSEDATESEGEDEPAAEPEAETVSFSPDGADIRPTPDGTFREGRVPILMYHYVSVPPDDADIYRLDLSVTPDQFEEQLAWLDDNGYTTITLYQFTEWLTDGTELPEKPVILTFDDGYRDNYENAFPIMQKYGQVGTFFILTGVTEAGDPNYMTWAMLREMAEAGMNIEIHAHEHLDLANRDDAYLKYQVADPADILEQRLGYHPRFMAYPGGSYDENTIKALKDADYWLGLTTRFGCLHFTGGEYELPRIRVRGDYSLAFFADLLESAFDDEEFCYGWSG
jgi:peptidoglycan/xylan/chitin deacetylase (PgdA/CDA1 family)